jgi:nitrogen fixation/metabolism regulation signal transduction histidine kinase
MMRFTKNPLNNESIQRKLLLSYVMITLSFVVIFGVFFTLHYIALNRYKTTSEALILQYRLIDATAEYIQTYNSTVKYIGDKDKLNQYNTSVNKINTIFSALDKHEYDSESKAAYLGLKNVITSITKEGDLGVKEVIQGDFSKISDHYAIANKIYPYVRESTADLVLKELEYAKRIQRQIEITQKIVDIGIVVLFLLIVTLSMLAANSFSLKLVNPLIKLKKSAEDVALGNMNVKIDKSVLHSKNEIGTLANAFDVMITKIRQNIIDLKETNGKLVDSQKETQLKNDELSRINKYMVDRELRMIELKEDLEKLREKYGIKEEVTDISQKA